MMRLSRIGTLVLAVAASVAVAACDALLTDPAPPPATVNIAFQITPTGPGTSATAFSRVRRIALRFITPDSAPPRDTIVPVVPTNGEIRARIKLETNERVDGLAIVARLEGPTGPLFDAAAVTQIQPGVPTTVNMNLLPVPAAVVADRAMLTMPGPGSVDSLSSAVLFSSGDTINGLSGAWLSQDPTVVAIAPNGLAGAVAIGTTNLELRFDTLLTLVPAEVTPPPVATVTVTPASPIIGVAGTVSLTAVTRDAQNNILVGRAITWSTSDPAVATVDASGVVTGVSPGSATITATSEGIDGTANVTVTGIATGRVSWINPAGGLWSVGTNWSTGAPPVAGDSVEIALNGSYQVVMDITPPSLTWISVGGGTGSQLLDVPGAGLVTVTGATEIVGTGQIVLSGTPVWNGGGILVGASATLRIANGSVGASVTNSGLVDIVGAASLTSGLINNGSGTVQLDATLPTSLNVSPGLDNAGTVILSSAIGNGSSLVVAGAALTNQPGGTLDVQAGGGGPRTIDAIIDNQGQFTVGGPLTTTTFGGSHTNSGTVTLSADWTISGANAFTDTGTLDLASGDLSVTLSGTGAGFSKAVGLTVPAGRTLTVDGGPFAAAVIGGAGTLQLQNLTVTGPQLTLPSTLTTQVGNVTVSSDVSNAGLIEVLGPTSFNGSALLTNSGSTIRLLAVTPGALTVANGFFNQGLIELNSQFGNTSQLTVSSGVLINTVNGTIATPAGGGGSRIIDAFLDNQGQIAIGTFTTINQPGGTFVNAGTITLNSDLTISGGDGFQESGTLDMSAGSFTLNLTGTGTGFTTSSPIVVGTGERFWVDGGPVPAMTLGGGGGRVRISNATVNPGTALFVSAASILELDNATVTPSLSNLGLIEVMGGSALNGPFTNAAGATLRLLAQTSAAPTTIAAGFTNDGTIDMNSALGGNPILTVAGTIGNSTTGTIRASFGGGGTVRTINADVNTAGAIDLQVPLVIGGNLTEPVGFPSSFTSNGASLTVDGLNVDGATFNDMPLVATGVGTFTLFNNVTFAGMDPTVVQFDFSHPGAAAAPVSMVALTFSTTPTTGSYMAVRDSDGPSPAILTLNVISSIPFSGAAQSLTFNGAVLNW